MSRIIQTLPLSHAMPGTRRLLTVWRYGKKGGRKAYLQAGLHADEVPGMLVLDHLARQLDLVAEAIMGEIILVPVANPIGLDQVMNEKPLGRFSLKDRSNFNRHYPEISQKLAARLAHKLGPDAALNVQLIRLEALNILAELKARDEAEALRHTLLSLSIDADIVLDLHCDELACVHLYTGEALWPEAADLAAEIGSAVTLLAQDSGGTPFDEANSALWWQLAALLPQHSAHIPAACLAATVELRGQKDVSQKLAAQDAAALWRFLKRRGFLPGPPPPALPPLKAGPHPLAGMALVHAPFAGLVTYDLPLPSPVCAGECIGMLLDPSQGLSQPLTSPIDGIFFAGVQHALVPAGEVIAKISGATPLPDKGKNLLTAR
jgi:uncharacterized protein